MSRNTRRFGLETLGVALASLWVVSCAVEKYKVLDRSPFAGDAGGGGQAGTTNEGSGGADSAGSPGAGGEAGVPGGGSTALGGATAVGGAGAGAGGEISGGAPGTGGELTAGAAGSGGAQAGSGGDAASAGSAGDGPGAGGTAGAAGLATTVGGSTGTGGSAGTAGAGVGGTAGTSVGGLAGTAGSGVGGFVGTAGAGAGGVAGAAGSAGHAGDTGADALDDLIGAICDWEFRCCDSGELDYRLSPFIASVQSCRDTFVQELHESVQTDNPYVSGSATELLGTLAYTLNLDRVTVNEAGVAECIAEYESKPCHSTPAESARCVAPTIPGTGACALQNLVDPALQVDDPCTLALTEGNGNDVECPAGSTCLAYNARDNPNGYDACIARGVDSEACEYDSDCEYDYYCSSSACLAKGDVNDACSFNSPSNPAPNDEDAACKTGLRCNPITLTCVPNCAEGYVCDSDSECPEGQSCAPLTVGGESSSFHVCRALGTTAADRCDDHADCVEDGYCNFGTCAPDHAIGDACAAQERCAAGSFCDLATIGSDGNTRTPSGLCHALLMTGEPCYPSAPDLDYPNGCAPSAPECVWDSNESRFECTGSRLPNGSDCRAPSGGHLIGDHECQSGLCEVVGGNGTPVCTGGASLGDDCDDDVTDAVAPVDLRCGAGLYCLPLTHQCVARADPGGDCEDPNIASSPNDDLCKNGSCVSQWDDLMCTDEPVPESAGGTAITCDGA